MSYRENSFPIEKDRVNLQVGVINGIVICVEDGSIDVIWHDASTATIAMLAGDAFDFRNTKLATIASGTYHSAA